MLRRDGLEKNRVKDFTLMNELITSETLENGVIILSINRPDALNAINKKVLTELRAKLEAISKDETVRVLVLRGAGDKSFIAGADIVEMKDMNRSDASDLSRLGHAVALLLEQMPKVTIAAVQGFALGGGTELALACDFILASEKALFGLPEVSLGVIPGFGGTIRLARAIGPSKAKEMIFSGIKLKSNEAKEIGLIRTVYPQEGFFDLVKDTAQKIAKNSMLALVTAKKLMNEFQETSGTYPKIDAEIHQFAFLFDGADQKEGMLAFTEKRAPKFKGL